MSILIDYWVCCDECGEHGFASRTKTQSREEARLRGWRRERGRDLCPKCKVIPEHMRDVLIEKGLHTVTWGDAGSLDECARRSGLVDKDVHPFDRWKQVIAALEQSPLFEKFYVGLDVFKHNQHRKVRAFRLKEL